MLVHVCVYKTQVVGTTTDNSLDTHTKWHFPTQINLNARYMSSEKVDELQAIVDLIMSQYFV